MGRFSYAVGTFERRFPYRSGGLPCLNNEVQMLVSAPFQCSHGEVKGKYIEYQRVLSQKREEATTVGFERG